MDGLLSKYVYKYLQMVQNICYDNLQTIWLQLQTDCVEDKNDCKNRTIIMQTAKIYGSKKVKDHNRQVVMQSDLVLESGVLLGKSNQSCQLFLVVVALPTPSKEWRRGGTHGGPTVGPRLTVWTRGVWLDYSSKAVLLKLRKRVTPTRYDIV